MSVAVVGARAADSEASFAGLRRPEMATRAVGAAAEVIMVNSEVRCGSGSDETRSHAVAAWDVKKGEPPAPPETGGPEHTFETVATSPGSKSVYCCAALRDQRATARTRFPSRTGAAAIESARLRIESCGYFR